MKSHTVSWQSAEKSENTFTGADTLLATCLAWAERLEVPLTVTLHEYVERTTSRRAYRLAYLANQRS